MYIDKDEDIINVDDFKVIEQFAICSICQGVLVDPVQCQVCENSFCKSCMEDWLKKAKVCPFHCPRLDMKESPLIKNMLSGLIIKCKNGCGFPIPYNELQEHYESKCSKIDFSKKLSELKEKYDKLKEEYDKLMAEGKAENPELKVFHFLSKHHVHPLVYLKTERKGWICDVCKITSTDYSYYCSLCDFDLCSKCKEKENQKTVKNIKNEKIEKKPTCKNQ